MNREWWTALVDACVLAISLLVAEFVEARWADMIVKVVAAFQPVVLGYVLAVHAQRIKADVQMAVRGMIEELHK
jgi:hypothetical protein